MKITNDKLVKYIRKHHHKEVPLLSCLSTMNTKLYKTLMDHFATSSNNNTATTTTTTTPPTTAKTKEEEQEEREEQEGSELRISKRVIFKQEGVL